MQRKELDYFSLKKKWGKGQRQVVYAAGLRARTSGDCQVAEAGKRQKREKDPRHAWEVEESRLLWAQQVSCETG